MMYNISKSMDLQPHVMLRIHVIRTIRTIMFSPLISALIVVSLVILLSIIVSIGDVVANIMSQVDWAERFSYTISSVTHSRIIVQTLIGLIFVASIVASVNSVRKMRYMMFGSTQQV